MNLMIVITSLSNKLEQQLQKIAVIRDYFNYLISSRIIKRLQLLQTLYTLTVILLLL